MKKTSISRQITIPLLTTIVLTITVFAYTSVSAQAENQISSSERAVTLELLTQLHTEELVDKSLIALRSIFTDKLSETKTTPEIKLHVDDYEQKVFDVLLREFSWETQRELYAQGYAAALTEEQLNSAVKFLETDAGQAFLKGQYQIEQYVKQKNKVVIESIKPELTALGNEMRRNLKQLLEDKEGSQ